MQLHVWCGCDWCGCGTHSCEGYTCCRKYSCEWCKCGGCCGKYSHGCVCCGCGKYSCEGCKYGWRLRLRKERLRGVHLLREVELHVLQMRWLLRKVQLRLLVLWLRKVQLRGVQMMRKV